MENPQEELLATWEEKAGEKSSIPQNIFFSVIIGVALLIIGSILVGFFTKNWTWYLAAAVIVSATAAIISQAKHSTKSREITITNLRIVVDERSYAISDMAGFWLEKQHDLLVITFEQKQRALLPLTCYYQNENVNEVTELLTQVLPEVDARPEHFTDRLNSYFHF